MNKASRLQPRPDLRLYEFIGLVRNGTFTTVMYDGYEFTLCPDKAFIYARDFFNDKTMSYIRLWEAVNQGKAIILN